MAVVGVCCFLLRLCKRYKNKGLGAAGRGWVDFVASGRLRLAFDWRSRSTFCAFLEGRAMDVLHREHVFFVISRTCV